MDGTATSAWSRIDACDGAGALVDAVLELDPDETYTRKELSEAADVCYKTLYLDGAVEVVVELGLLERREDGPEGTFAVATGTPVYEAAIAFADAAVADRRRPDAVDST